MAFLGSTITLMFAAKLNLVMQQSLFGIVLECHCDASFFIMLCASLQIQYVLYVHFLQTNRLLYTILYRALSYN